MRWPSSDTLIDDVSVVRALKPHFIARPSQFRCVALFIHDCPKLELTDDSQIQNFYVTTSTCIRTLLDTYISMSMIMKFCIWANDDSQYRVLVLHARVDSYNKWNDDSQIWTTCTARSWASYANLTISCIVMETHVRTPMWHDIQYNCTLQTWPDRIECINLACPCTLPSSDVTLSGSAYMYCTNFNASAFAWTLSEYRYSEVHMYGMISSRFRTIYGLRWN